jgi:phage recombination protein Bet
MTNEVATTQDDRGLIAVLQSSLYPGASPQAIGLVIGYCKAAGLDPMLKPVHIVPMWDSKSKSMRDVVMPGIGLYRTQAARSGQFAGMSEPEFGPDITEKIGGQEITYPDWCKVTVKRALASGIVAEFTALEFWRENYAVKGGQEKSIAPNAMWTKRPRGQLAKCASAQALRIAFPEIGSQPTAEEMEGKPLDADRAVAEPEAPAAPEPSPELLAKANAAAAKGVKAYRAFWKGITIDDRTALMGRHATLKAAADVADAQAAVDSVVIDGTTGEITSQPVAGPALDPEQQAFVDDFNKGAGQ